MRCILKPHLDSPPQAVKSIEVEVSRAPPDRLLFTYRLTGSVADLLLPPTKASERTDRLWEHSCFEAFLKAGMGTAYYEFNFSPSRQWAAYRLEDYRGGMTAASAAPRVEVGLRPDLLELQATVQLPPDAGGALGLSAVIEEADGRKSYWALAHPPGEPDFHHKDCFAAQLPEMTEI